MIEEDDIITYLVSIVVFEILLTGTTLADDKHKCIVTLVSGVVLLPVICKIQIGLEVSVCIVYRDEFTPCCIVRVILVYDIADVVVVLVRLLIINGITILPHPKGSFIHIKQISESGKFL